MNWWHMMRLATMAMAACTFPACAADDGTGDAATSPAWLYVVDAGGGTSRIVRVRTDGTAFSTVLDPAPAAARGIVYDATSRTLLWASRDGDRIQRAALEDGVLAPPQDVVTAGLDSAYAVALDARAGHIYWSDYGTRAIHRANADGSDAVVLVTGLGAPRGLDIDVQGGWLYWTDVGTTKVQRSRLDGADVQDLLTAADGLVRPYGVTVDAAGGRLYIADAGSGQLLRVRVDGSGLEVLIADSGPHPSFILLAPDEDRLYWTDNRANRIRRARLDGSGIEDVLAAGLSGPRGLVRIR